MKKKRFDTDYFIKKSKGLFGDQFDYSKAKYEGNRKEVTLICKLHGEFDIKPIYHYSSNAGCPKCSIERPKSRLVTNLESFIKEATNVHGDGYCYDEVEYTKSSMKVRITCNICNHKFEQTPNSHLRGSGCRKCGFFKSTVKLSRQDFIKQCNAVHGKSKYQYLEYNGRTGPLTIKCNECQHITKFNHADSHDGTNRSTGCGLCSKRNPKGMSEELFFKRLKYHHPYYDDHDFSNYEYTGILNKSLVICPKGHQWNIMAQSLTNGNKCCVCNSLSLSEGLRKPLIYFIDKANDIHGHRYEYSCHDHKNSKSKVNVTCKKCDSSFETTLDSHTAKDYPSRCKTCFPFSGGFSRSEDAIIYSFKVGSAYKIGITNSTLRGRYRNSEYHTFSEIIQHQLSGQNAHDLERHLIRMNQHLKYDGPQLLYDTGITEMFRHEILPRRREKIEQLIQYISDIGGE